VDYTVSLVGLLVHVRGDWPCAVCRPFEISQRPTRCLCLDCAYALLAVAGAQEEGAHALLGEITEDVGFLAALRGMAGQALN
jgi:hypothetical protein